MAMITADPTDVPRVDRFSFSAEGEKKIADLVAQYPAGRQASAVIAVLDLAQREHGGWLPRAAMDEVARVLDMAPIRVYEVATFYTMFSLRPRGKHLLQVCTTTPCWLRGSDAVMKACREVTGVGPGEVSADGLFSTVEVECLGACVNAPVIQINDDFFEDLDDASTRRVLEALKRGENPACGPQIERQTSAPVGGRTTLLAGGMTSSGS
jgi:NADH-quinone oxidoreductase E subunit